MRLLYYRLLDCENKNKYDLLDVIKNYENKIKINNKI